MRRFKFGLIKKIILPVLVLCVFSTHLSAYSTQRIPIQVPDSQINNLNQRLTEPMASSEEPKKLDTTIQEDPLNRREEQNEGQFTIYQSQKLTKLLEIEKEFASLRGIQEMTIQIASEASLEAVKTDCESFENLFQQSCEIKYEAPNYKCWCGRYNDDLVAQRNWSNYKINFPNALIINIK